MSTLAAARADNFYIPKDFDPKKHISLNDYNKKKQAEKLRQKYGDNYDPKKVEANNKIRFEAPFHIKCNTCNNMMAKGKRFNAVKKAVGKYLSTTIWEFTIVCKACPEKIKVQTDPKNTDFQVVSGARRIFRTENSTDGVIVDAAKQFEL